MSFQADAFQNDSVVGGLPGFQVEAVAPGPSPQPVVPEHGGSAKGHARWFLPDEFAAGIVDGDGAAQLSEIALDATGTVTAFVSSEPTTFGVDVGLVARSADAQVVATIAGETRPDRLADVSLRAVGTAVGEAVGGGSARLSAIGVDGSGDVDVSFRAALLLALDDDDA